MPAIQDFDRKRFVKTHPIYQGRGLVLHSRLPYQPRNSKYSYLPKQGGFIDLGTLINAGTTAVNFIKDNKDVIGNIASGVGGIAGAAKSISDTVKASKELEHLKLINEMAKKKKERKTKKAQESIEMTPEQEARLKMIGSGFTKL